VLRLPDNPFIALPDIAPLKHFLDNGGYTPFLVQYCQILAEQIRLDKVELNLESMEIIPSSRLRYPTIHNRK
jgi:hypothetical protein